MKKSMFRPHLIVLEETESTQDIAGEMALDDAPSGTAVMALSQSRGRGRSRSDWYSPPGKNLALSVIIRPTVKVQESPLLGMLASITIADLVDDFCDPFRAYLKWPNDVLAQDRKIAGILSEARILNGIVEFIVLGVGLNVNSEVEDFPEELRESLTSFFIIKGKTFDLKKVGMSFLERLAELVYKVEHEGTDFIPLLWEQRWRHKGQRLLRDGFMGTAIGIGPDGGLLMQIHDGEILNITSGTISLLQFPSDF